jgi:hypothetical protein
MESNVAFKDPELSAWMKYNWLIEVQQADYTTFGKAIADLENTEPLLSITKLTIRALPGQEQSQQIDLMVSNIIQKK